MSAEIEVNPGVKFSQSIVALLETVYDVYLHLSSLLKMVLLKRSKRLNLNYVNWYLGND